MVAMNYRLNIFGFGDGKGTAEVNLALKDQALALEWVRKYIEGFGGDPVRTATHLISSLLPDRRAISSRQTLPSAEKALALSMFTLT